MREKNKKRKKFAHNQTVVFRFGERKLVGKIYNYHPVGKEFIYDVLCEDGKIYTELTVDSKLNQTIDTYLTKLFYNKYNITDSPIPTEQSYNGPRIQTESVIEEQIPEDEVDSGFHRDEELFTLYDDDPDSKYD